MAGHATAGAGQTGRVTGARAFGPRRAVLLGELAGAVGLLLVAALADDRGGRVLGGLAGLLLLAVAVHDLLVRPVLVADATGLTVASGRRRRHVPWAAVERLEASTESRRGVRSRLLEVDTGDTLLLLSQRRLGQDPADVADALGALRGVRPSAPTS